MSSALSTVSSVIMLTDGEAAEVWLTAQPNPEEGPSSKAWEVDFIIQVTDSPLIADPREMMISSELKLNLFEEDRDSWASCKDVTSRSGPLRGNGLFDEDLRAAIQKSILSL